MYAHHTNFVRLQDAMDLMSGRYTVNRNSPSPFLLNGFDTFSNCPIANATLLPTHMESTTKLTFLLLTLTFYFDTETGRNAQHLMMSSVICAGIAAGMMALVKVNGRQFCSRPRLCGLL
ncbi:hypothetical protein CsSME_00017550 [Camellia sinensis var. sinensis]